ncbi:hypothetical protein KP509_07G025600 [Ceratopteris richardii]|uniref:Uncharacterized protein n=1 Tax=Ceratopteris richardii TaxID=49495 RepID=A0A8T2UGP5_CERRI|nr:hypothetical protein KP509_07G025600 [Ceratopteris richardii]
MRRCDILLTIRRSHCFQGRSRQSNGHRRKKTDVCRIVGRGRNVITLDRSLHGHRYRKDQLGTIMKLRKKQKPGMLSAIVTSSYAPEKSLLMTRESKQNTGRIFIVIRKSEAFLQLWYMMASKVASSLFLFNGMKTFWISAFVCRSYVSFKQKFFSME